jgi:membrane protease YdiL (CAAX protease family)
MSDEPELLPATSSELPPPPPERDPFWGYSDLALFIGLALPCMLAALLVMKGATSLLHIPDPAGATQAVGGQFLFYLLIFLSLRVMFQVQYGRPFWQSLGWKEIRLPVFTIAMLGVATAVTVAIAGAVLRTPDTPNQITEMMRDPLALILLAIFGVTLAPVCEELAFRGFLQPLLVRSLGAAPGILIAGASFGLLHYHEYGDSWRHAVVLTLSGVAFGCLRHYTGSTKASVLMHSSYNAFLFIVLFTQRKDLPHLW